MPEFGVQKASAPDVVGGGADGPTRAFHSAAQIDFWAVRERDWRAFGIAVLECWDYRSERNGRILGTDAAKTGSAD